MFFFVGNYFFSECLCVVLLFHSIFRRKKDDKKICLKKKQTEKKQSCFWDEKKSGGFVFFLVWELAVNVLFLFFFLILSYMPKWNKAKQKLVPATAKSSKVLKSLTGFSFLFPFKCSSFIVEIYLDARNSSCQITFFSLIFFSSC